MLMLPCYRTIILACCLLFLYPLTLLGCHEKITPPQAIPIVVDSLSPFPKKPYFIPFYTDSLVVKEFPTQQHVSPKKKSIARKRKGKTAFPSQ